MKKTILHFKAFLICFFYPRQRVFLSRNRMPRLRYSMLLMLCIGAGMGASAVKQTFSDDIGSVAMQMAALEPLAGLVGADDIANHTHDDLLQASLYDNFNLSRFLRGNGAEDSQPKFKTVTVKKGEAFGTVMARAGITAGETTAVLAALKEKDFTARDLKAGQEIAFTFRINQDGTRVFNSLKMPLDPVETIVVTTQPGADNGDIYTAAIEEKPVERMIRAKQATVIASLYGSAAKAGIPDTVTANAIKIFSWNTDFQRDIQPDDVLEVMYESFETEDGHVAKTGDILYARLKTARKDVPLYRYEMADGRIDYFMPDGISIKRTLMKTPVQGARLSSGYGMRRHPVLGYRKMHKGLDFAARTGTPIYAAGDGVIEEAGWKGSYGKYVRIRHNGVLKTAYAHMHKINVKSGTRVKQGDVIGTIGSTGRSTGPHLHYEVLKNGVQVNPRSVDLPTGEELKGSDKKNFEVAMRKVQRQFIASLEGTKIALFKREDNQKDS